MFPTGRVVDELVVPGVPGGKLQATLINAGIAMVFIDAAAIGCSGAETQDAINGDADALARFESIRAHAALRMGLIDDLKEAPARQHTPKIAFVAPPATYTAAGGRCVAAGDVDLLVRALSMGKLHHAMMGTAAVAVGAAAAIPGTLVNLVAGGGAHGTLRIGHPSGVLRVGVQARRVAGTWQVIQVSMSRSARVLMEGRVFVPGVAF
jgi:2-methylaconitate cis-trans-isomerase PrpF